MGTRFSLHQGTTKLICAGHAGKRIVNGERVVVLSVVLLLLFFLSRIFYLRPPIVGHNGIQNLRLPDLKTQKDNGPP